MNIEFKGKRIFVNGLLFGKFIRGCKHCSRQHRVFTNGKYHAVNGYEMEDVRNKIIELVKIVLV